MLLLLPAPPAPLLPSRTQQVLPAETHWLVLLLLPPLLWLLSLCLLLSLLWRRLAGERSPAPFRFIAAVAAVGLPPTTPSSCWGAL